MNSYLFVCVLTAVAVVMIMVYCHREQSMDETDKENANLRRENERIRASWKPEEGIYCACTFEDNHNPALISECEYHREIRGALIYAINRIGIVHKILTENGGDDAEKMGLLKDGLRADLTIFEQFLHLKTYHSDSDSEIDAICEICHIDSDRDSTIRKRFVPTCLCLRCADKDLIVKEDLSPRESDPVVNWNEEKQS